MSSSIPTAGNSRRYAPWVICGSAFVIALGLCIVWTIAKRASIADWPTGAPFDWARELDLTQAASRPENAFTISGISYINGAFYASCTYRNTDPDKTVLVQGVVGSYGRFCPKVALEVASESPSRWKKVGDSPKTSGKTETKAVAPGQTIIVHVDLDAYRALIRKYRYARLVTQTGASGVIELKSLLPPCEKWPAGMDCLPTPPEPDLSPISEPESKNE